MKNITIVVSVIFLTLSGCAHTGYQHGYVGYNSGYTVNRYYDYDSHEHGYYSPGTSFIYERSYVQPRLDHRHHEHDYYPDRHNRRDWRQPMQQPSYFGGGHVDSGRRHDRDRDQSSKPSHRNVERVPNWTVGPQHRKPDADLQRRSPGADTYRRGNAGHRHDGDGEHHWRDDRH